MRASAPATSLAGSSLVMRAAQSLIQELKDRVGGERVKGKRMMGRREQWRKMLNSEKG